MDAVVVAQATGLHGWSSLEVYLNGLRELGLRPRLIQPRAEWGADELVDDDGLFELLALRGTVPIIFCGFDWHSQPIHTNSRFRTLIRSWRGPRIGLFQEHLSAQWIRANADTAALFHTAVQSAAESLTHIACNHEEDLLLLPQLGIHLPSLFLPFSADLSVFHITMRLADRDQRAFFRGKILEFNGQSPYADRTAIAQRLASFQGAVIQDLVGFDFLDRQRLINQYVSDLNQYAIQLNLPSVSDSLTCRPFEIMACGGLLMQSRVAGDLSQRLLPAEHYVEFNRHSADSLPEIISVMQRQPEAVAKIADAGFKYISRFHSGRTRVKQLLRWAVEHEVDSRIYDEFVRNAPQALSTEKAAQHGMNIRQTDLTKDASTGSDQHAVSAKQSARIAKNAMNRIDRPKILIDLVFYQHANTGIASVWNRVLSEWLEFDLSSYVILARRDGAIFSPPEEVMEQYDCITLPSHGSLDDRSILEEACQRHRVTLVLSTYYSTPRTVPTLLLVHDLIPEWLDHNCYEEPMWAEKKLAIEYASGYFCVSGTTAKDLQKFYPIDIHGKPLYVTYNEFPQTFQRAEVNEINAFREKYSLRRRYLLFVGERIGYLGYKNIDNICRILGLLAVDRPDFAREFSLLFLGGAVGSDRLTVEATIDCHLVDWHIQRISVPQTELSTAYSGAAFLIYPSTIEGFGLPPGEALSCGTPTIAWDTAINREIYGDKIQYLSEVTDGGLVNELAALFDSAEALTKRAGASSDVVNARRKVQGGASQAGSMIECALFHAQRLLDLANPAYAPVLFDCEPSFRTEWLERLIWGHPSETTGAGLGFGNEKLRSAALVSIYKGLFFIKECLRDLIEQTEYIDGRLEFILIDSASPQQEYNAVFSILREKPRFLYMRTAQRETLYRSWNRAARYSRAQYLSNANLDDRHRVDSFAQLGQMLDEQPNVELIYPSQYLTTIPNERFAEHLPIRTWAWPEYSMQQLRIGNHVGSQPMWRRSLHARIGYFLERFMTAADYEFWCRIAHKAGPLKLHPVHLGLYYFNAQGIEHGDPLQSGLEVAEICEMYGIENNYVVSEKDRERSEGLSIRKETRQLEDLQYSGIPLSGVINVVIHLSTGLAPALVVVDALLCQTVTINHRLDFYLISDEWSTLECEVLNSPTGLLGRLCSNIRAYATSEKIKWARPDVCTVVASAAPTERGLLEQAMISLYGSENGKRVTTADGSLQVSRKTNI